MSVRRVRRALTAAVMVIAACALTAASCAAPPPELYDVPAGSSGAPGSIVKTAPSSFGGSDNYTATAVQYRSTTATGQSDNVTGTIVVPNAPWG